MVDILLNLPLGKGHVFETIGRMMGYKHKRQVYRSFLIIIQFDSNQSRKTSLKTKRKTVKLRGKTKERSR